MWWKWLLWCMKLWVMFIGDCMKYVWFVEVGWNGVGKGCWVWVECVMIFYNFMVFELKWVVFLLFWFWFLRVGLYFLIFCCSVVFDVLCSFVFLVIVWFWFWLMWNVLCIWCDLKWLMLMLSICLVSLMNFLVLLSRCRWLILLVLCCLFIWLNRFRKLCSVCVMMLWWKLLIVMIISVWCWLFRMVFILCWRWLSKYLMISVLVV